MSQDITPNPTFEDSGLDNFGQNNLDFIGSEINQKANTAYEAGVPSQFIQDGDIVSRINVVEGHIQSNGFESGVQGWKIDGNGNLEANNGVFRGSISASTITGGTVSGTTITGGTVSGTTITGGDIQGTSISTDTITDNTYGAKGVFAICLKTTQTSGTWWVPIAPINGGLLNATLNFTGSSGDYGLLPGFNTGTYTSYYHISKSGGYYYFWANCSGIYADVSYNTLYATITFNSLETNGW